MRGRSVILVRSFKRWDVRDAIWSSRRFVAGHLQAILCEGTNRRLAQSSNAESYLINRRSSFRNFDETNSGACAPDKGRRNEISEDARPRGHCRGCPDGVRRSGHRLGDRIDMHKRSRHEGDVSGRHCDPLRIGGPRRPRLDHRQSKVRPQTQGPPPKQLTGKSRCSRSPAAQPRS